LRETALQSTQPLVTTHLEMRAPAASRGQRFAGANSTAGGRELFANRPREAGDLVLGKTKKSQIRGQKFRVQEFTEPNWKFNRDMYFKVGEKWKWIDKRPWTDEQWNAYARDPNLRTFAGYCGEALIGYYELKRSAASPSRSQRTAISDQKDQEEVEIAYFGLLPEMIACGLGGPLLSSAIENAWTWTPTPSRVWVHTCNRDHPNALANYQARGFKIYKVEEEA
jgi:GNAT superfamily N-acetyltransferase